MPEKSHHLQWTELRSPAELPVPAGAAGPLLLAEALEALGCRGQGGPAEVRQVEVEEDLGTGHAKERNFNS